MRRFVLGLGCLMMAVLGYGVEAPGYPIDPVAETAGLSLYFQFGKDSSYEDVRPDSSVNLRIIVDSGVAGDYKLDGLTTELISVGPYTPVQIRTISQNTKVVRFGAPVYETTFGFRLDILPTAKPRTYPVNFKLKMPSGKIASLAFDLPVGATDCSLVQVRPPTGVIVDAGGRKEIALEIRNNYPDYRIRIFGYRLQCPDGLVTEQTFDEKNAKDPILTVPHGTTGVLRIPLHGETMSALTNLEAKPKANVTLYYDDNFRMIAQLVPGLDLDFEMRFPVWQRFLCALIGGLVGVWLRGLLPGGYGSLPGRRRPGALSRYSTGAIMAALGWALSLGLQLQLMAMGGRSLVSYSTPFGSLMLGIAFGVLHPSKVAQFVERLFSKSLDSEPAEAN